MNNNSNIENKKTVYFDNAATSLKPQCVYESLSNRKYYTNIWRSGYQDAHFTEVKVKEAINKLKSYFNISDDYDIILTSGATEAINIVAQCFLPIDLSGKIVVSSQIEHHSNYLPWKVACKQRKGTLLFADYDVEKSLYTIDDYLSEKTNIELVAITQVSNVLGNVIDVFPVISFCKSKQIPVLIDATQAAAHIRVDITKINADFVVLSAHKMYGPFGIGALILKKSRLKEMHPWKYGGGMVLNALEMIWKDGVESFYAGTMNPPAIIAWGDAIDYINKSGIEKIGEKTNYLIRLLYEELNNQKNIKIFTGDIKSNVGILSFVCKNMHSHDVGEYLFNNGFCVGVGNHCTQPLMKTIGESSVIRVSLCDTNTVEEIYSFIECIQKLLNSENDQYQLIYGDVTDLLSTDYGEESSENKLEERMFVSVDGTGIVCGDKLQLNVTIKNKCIFFVAKGDSCIIAKTSFVIMNQYVSGCSLIEARKRCFDIINTINNRGLIRVKELNALVEKFGDSRIDCIKLPWRLLANALSVLEKKESDNFFSNSKNEDDSPLDCDSCVKISSVLGENAMRRSSSQLKELISFSNNDMITTFKRLRKVLGKNPAKLTKLISSTTDIVALKKLEKIWTPECLEYYRKIKSIELIFDAFKRNNIDVPENLEKLYQYKKEHHMLNRDLWREAKAILQNGGIPYLGIKGVATVSYYDKAQKERFSSDIDILTSDDENFFKAISAFLLSDKKYYLHEKLGLVGSLKIYQNSFLSGHIHLVKYIDEKMVTVDLSFPHIPISNIQLLNIPIEYDCGVAKLETAILYLTVHAFKHSRLPIKEINDLYMIARSVEKDKVDYEALFSDLKKNHLRLKFCLLVYAMRKHYGKSFDSFSCRMRVYEKCVSRFLVFCGWPYSHFLHQFIRYLYNKWSVKDKFDPYQDDVVKALTSRFGNKRIYFIPVVSFDGRDLLNQLLTALDQKDIIIKRINYVLMMLSDHYYIGTDSGLFLLSDHFDFERNELSVISDYWKSIIKFLPDSYRVELRLVWNSDKNMWTYR